MKKLFILIAFATPVLAAQAQTTDSTAAAASAAAAAMAGTAPVHKLKTNDQVLPRWSFDLGYRYGLLSQNLEMISLEQSYGPNSLGTSKYVQPSFSNGSGSGGEASINYFFNRKRTLGIGIGVQYMHYVGELKMDTMYADFQAVDSKNRTYRQIIHTVGPLTEDVKINNLNVPVLFRFKHQFGRAYKPSSFGITADIGPVFGMYNQTQADVSGKFSYEAIYKLNQANGDVVSGFESNPVPSTGSALVLSQAEYGKDGRNAGALLDALFAQNQGFNVGLDKSVAPAQRSQTGNYNAVSFGGMAQLGLTYQLSYHVTFMLGGYFMYQSYTNTGNDTYQPVSKLEDVGGTSYSDYRPLTSGVKKSDYSSYGLNAGFRIFFGEKRDVDDDGIPDAIDRCKLEYGEARFNGCPDRDHDGIADSEDACPDEPGGEGTNGCPDEDQDGVPNKLDHCPTEFGELRDGCPVGEAAKYAPVDTTRTRVENGAFLPPHIVLETDVLYFGYGRSDIQDTIAKVLDYALRILNKENKVIIYISGYTDDIGNEKSNLFLSYQRAKSAKNYFVKKGIDPKRIIIGSYGMESPAVPNNTPEGKARNRRIEMKLLLPL